MIRFDADYILDLIEEYVNGDVKGHNKEIHSTVAYHYEKFVEDYDIYYGGKWKIRAVLNGFQPSFSLVEDEESTAEEEKLNKIFRKVSKIDIAHITANFGFLFGLVYAENERLKFFKREVELPNEGD